MVEYSAFWWSINENFGWYFQWEFVHISGFCECMITWEGLEQSLFSEYIVLGNAAYKPPKQMGQRKTKEYSLSVKLHSCADAR